MKKIPVLPLKKMRRKEKPSSLTPPLKTKNPLSRILPLKPFRQWRKTPLYLGIFLAAVLIALGCGAASADQGEPSNPLTDKAAAVDQANVDLLCDSTEDETVYVPIPVSGEKQDGLNSPTETEEPQNNKETPENNEEQTEQPKEQETPEAPVNTSPPAAEPSSGGSSNGGSGSGVDPGAETTDVDYFTTSIKDGETVTAAEYSFEIKHKIPSLTVKMVQVFVNGKLQSQFNNKVTLEEGSNTIRIVVNYEDAAGAALGPFGKSYTVNLDTKSLVINTSLKDQTVSEENFSFTASASYLGEQADLSITMNGEELTVDDENFKVTLKEGNNTFVLKAKAKNDAMTKSETYTVVYKDSGEFRIVTDLTNGATVDNSSFSFTATTKNGSAAAKCIVYLNGNKQTGSDGKYTVTLRSGANEIRISAIDGATRLNETYQITFERQKASADNPIPDKEHGPRVEVNLTSGQDIPGSKYTLDVIAYNYKGERLKYNYITVTLNGAEILHSWEDNVTSYLLQGYGANNELVIYVEDDDGYTARFTYTFTHTKTDGPTGYATISIEATTVGLGYLIAPVKIAIYDDETVPEVLDRVLQENGFTYHSTGSLAADFYLSRLYKNGMMRDYAIPEDLKAILDEVGIETTPNYDENSLGEFDLYGESGWMYEVNGDYPNYSASYCNLQDGDVLRIRYTLALGRDIGGSDAAGNNSNFPKEW